MASDTDVSTYHKHYFDDKPSSVARWQNNKAFRSWTGEIIAVVIGIGVVAALFALLSHFHGQLVPEWPFSINLGTLVSMLSIALRAVIATVLANVIGQSKWSWFDRSKPLSHLDRFDQATRGVSGAVQLMATAPKSLLIVIAALLTISSHAIEPFSQQAISTIPCNQPVVNSNASVPVSNSVNLPYFRTGAGMWAFGYSIKGALLNALTNPSGNDTAITATCPTGNCTFNAHDGVTYSSIGMCTQCIDTSNFINSSSSGNQTLPNGLWINPVGNSPFSNVMASDISWASSMFTPELEAASKATILNVTILTWTEAACSTSPDYASCTETELDSVPMTARPLSVSCMAYSCIKNFYGVVDNGNFSEVVVSETPAPQQPPSGQMGASYLADYSSITLPCWLDGQPYDASNFSSLVGNHTLNTITINGTNVTAPSECIYSLDGLTAMALNEFFTEQLLNGYCHYDPGDSFTLDCGDNWWIEPLFIDNNATFANVSKVMDEFATGMTNIFRSTGSTLTAIGTVSKTTVCMVFNWEWLLLPTLVAFLSAVLLAIIIIKQSQRPFSPAWKASSLPLLFYGLMDPISLPGVVSKTKLEKQANKMNVVFQVAEDAAGFVSAVPGSDRKSGDTEGRGFLH